jgi:hypothetical protein
MESNRFLSESKRVQIPFFDILQGVVTGHRGICRSAESFPRIVGARMSTFISALPAALRNRAFECHGELAWSRTDVIEVIKR